MRQFIDHEAFIFVWQRATSLERVAAIFRSTKDRIKVRASRLRVMGVPLKRFDAPGRVHYAARRHAGRPSTVLLGLKSLAAETVTA